MAQAFILNTRDVAVAGTLAAALLVPCAGASAMDAAAGATTQELAGLHASKLVASAQWSKAADSYVLTLVLDRSVPLPAKQRGAGDAVDRATADAAPKPATAAPPVPAPSDNGSAAERPSFFIGNTIANLRGVDPWIPCGRTLTLIDGRNGPPRNVPPQPDPLNQPYPPKVKEGRVEVWLLKADGTQILPLTYSCDAGSVVERKPFVEVSYAFPVAAGDQAVAAAIRIDEAFYIERLQP